MIKYQRPSPIDTLHTMGDPLIKEKVTVIINKNNKPNRNQSLKY